MLPVAVSSQSRGENGETAKTSEVLSRVVVPGAGHAGLEVVEVGPVGKCLLAHGDVVAGAGHASLAVVERLGTVADRRARAGETTAGCRPLPSSYSQSILLPMRPMACSTEHTAP